MAGTTHDARETIREALNATLIVNGAHPVWKLADDALAALDALCGEVEKLREALQRIETDGPDQAGWWSAELARAALVVGSPPEESHE